MKQKELQAKMRKFLDSYEFKHRDIKLVDNEFKDKQSGTVFAVIVNTLKEITALKKNRKYKNPVIFLSSKVRVLNRISEIYNLSDWNEERLNNLTDEEFDYIYLRQCNMLNVDNDF